MANKVREEGDFTYWDDGAQRYAKGNSLGKAPGSLAKRHPKAAVPIQDLSVSKRRELSVKGGNATAAKRRNWVSEAYASALLTHPDSNKEIDGLRMLAEAAFLQANDAEGGGAAVRARDQFIREYTGGQQPATVDARQVHITVTGEAASEMGRVTRLLEAVDEDGRE